MSNEHLSAHIQYYLLSSSSSPTPRFHMSVPRCQQGQQPSSESTSHLICEHTLRSRYSPYLSSRSHNGNLLPSLWPLISPPSLSTITIMSPMCFASRLLDDEIKLPLIQPHTTPSRQHLCLCIASHILPRGSILRGFRLFSND